MATPLPTPLSVLAAAGLSAKLDGDALRVGPRERLTPELRAYIRQHRDELVQAVRPDPALAFYAEVFAGHAGRAIVTLETRQIRRAVALGLIDPVLASASVVLAYRCPGVAGALLVIPPERYDAGAVLEAFALETPAP